MLYKRLHRILYVASASWGVNKSNECCVCLYSNDIYYNAGKQISWSSLHQARPAVDKILIRISMLYIAEACMMYV